MFDLTQYKWLDNDVKLDDTAKEYQKDVIKFLDILDKKDYLPGKKNILACYYIDQINKGITNNKKESKLFQKDYKAWYKSASFKKLIEKILKDDKDKFIITAIVTMMMTTLSIFFLNSVIHQRFLVTFSFDAIIGCATIVLLIRNASVRYKLVKRYSKSKDICYLDGAALLLCIFLRIMLPGFIDLTLVVLFIDHLVTKKRFEKYIDEFNINFKA